MNDTNNQVDDVAVVEDEVVSDDMAIEIDEETQRGMAGDQDAVAHTEGANIAKLYVGNLAYTVRAEDLRELFAQVGKVIDAVIIMDKFKQDWSKGFGFVEFASSSEAEAAVKQFNNYVLAGRPMQVNIAQPKPERREFGGGGGGDRGGYNRGGGDRRSGGGGGGYRGGSGGGSGGGYRGGGDRGGYRGGGDRGGSRW